jgi:hypothetical protein
MSAEVIVARLRQFMLVLACGLCVGLIIELWLTDHLQTPLQFVPFALCGLGLMALAWVLIRPNRNALWVLRAIMLIAALGGLLGTYEHLEHNLEFAREVNATKANAAPLWTALTGANPPLAPGALIVTAMIAGAATYVHPKLTK